jgi:GT2 family glycosyltransferase
MKTIAAVVTYNRKALLSRCLLALSAQTVPPDLILVVDNASTDGTLEMLQAEGWLEKKTFHLLALTENTGGAGGFAAAMEYALAKRESAWIWLMDDDALPLPDALAEVLRIARNPENLYGSLAIAGEECAWGLRLLDDKTLILRPDDMPSEASVGFLPLIGLLAHTDLLERIGVLEAGFFISCDDLEFCQRARARGAKVICAGKSRIEHPRAKVYVFNFFGIPKNCLQFEPWRRYYDVRNNLLTAKKHRNPSVFFMLRYLSIRLVATLCREPRKGAQFLAYLAGFIDGLLGIKGKRHTFWKIPK